MKIPKPSDDDKERFRSLVPDGPSVEVKAMFGNLAGFVNGNMFMGLFGSDIGLRLPEDERARLLATGGGRPFGPEDRPMKEYVATPAGWSDDEVADWAMRALEHVSSLPAKKPRTRAGKGR